MTHVVHFDRLGTATAQTDQSQTKTNSFSSDAFGNPYTVVNPTHTQTGFAGGWNYLTDSESGLMLLGHRYYDPGSGRFITRDPAQAGRNWYAYSLNNPVSGIDPSGLVSTDLTTLTDKVDVLLDDIDGGDIDVTKSLEWDQARNWHAHHAFPQQFRPRFEDMDMDVDKMLVRVPDWWHKHVHRKSGSKWKGGWWNEQWGNWFAEHDKHHITPTPAEAMRFLEYLMDSTGIPKRSFKDILIIER